MIGRRAFTRTRFTAERGSVLVIALLVLSGVLMLSAVAIGAAVQNSSSDRRDANDKGALEAAEAGLQVATYRLNMLNPASSYCVGDAVASPDSTGTCASSIYTLGNGSTYQYYTTPALSPSGACVGATLSLAAGINQRCVTAVGTANGITDRAQIRVAAYTATPLFQYAGATGLSGVTVTGNGAVNGAVASNKNISLTGNGSVGALYLGPSGTLTTSGNAHYASKNSVPTIVLDPVNPGTSNQTSLSACPARQAAGFPSCNDDYRITDGTASPIVSPYDQSSGVSFNAATRTLSLSGKASLTLGGSLYNFCQISLSGQATISLAPGAKTEIIIDSPDDPGSGCPSGTGSLSMSGQASWTNLSQDPTALQIFAYGLNNLSSTVQLSGNGNFWGAVYAPHSTVSITGNGTFNGAVVGNVVNLSGNGFNWNQSAGTLMATSNGIFYRTAWAQCTSAPTTASAPGSGCG
jgi:Tfp pilus assembly protein PilX